MISTKVDKIFSYRLFVFSMMRRTLIPDCDLCCCNCLFRGILSIITCLGMHAKGGVCHSPDKQILREKYLILLSML